MSSLSEEEMVMVLAMRKEAARLAFDEVLSSDASEESVVELSSKIDLVRKAADRLAKERGFP